MIAADDVTLENLELTGAHISTDNGANGAAIRLEARGLTVRACNIHDNQNGLLGGTTGTLTIEHTEFANNGLGDGCNQGGCTHNLYVANLDALYFRFNWSHRVATDTPDKGHLLKSRAKANYISYNRLTGEDGFDSYEIDLPNGGLAVLIGNQIEKGAHSGNGTSLSWGEEGASAPDKRVFLVGNTFVNDFGSGKFLSVSGATLTAHNNIFAGAGSIGSATALASDNWLGTDPSFVDAAHFDYHLGAGSPAIGKAVDPGTADQLSLVPVSEYLHPLAEVARASAHDLGAFEFGTKLEPLPLAGASAAAGDSAADGGHGSAAGGHAADGASGRGGALAGTAGAGGSSAGSGASAAGNAASSTRGGASGSASRAADGCNCTIGPGTRGASAAALSGAGLGAWIAARRLQRRARARQRKRTRER